jgi:polar amino acid transport system permease protein
MDRLAVFLDTFFRPDLIQRYWFDVLASMVVTIQVAVGVIVTGLALGLGLAVLRSFGLRPLNVLIVIYADLLRTLPPLVFLLLTYFGLPNFGVFLSSFVVLWVVLSLILAAFAEEIFWAGIISIRKEQWEAARSTGLNFLQTLAYVVLPQAVRLTIPPLTNRTVVITKNTALGSLIGVPEILNVSSTAVSFTGNLTPIMLGTIAYLALFVPVTVFGRWLETTMSWKRL